MAWKQRAGLVVGLVALLAGGTNAVAVAAAQQVPPCQEYVEVFQSTRDTNERVGPATNSRNPVEFPISQAAEQTRFVTHTGVIRPRRPAFFRYKNQFGAVVRTHKTQNSRDNGVIHHEPEQIPYNFTNIGDRVQIFADFSTRCGGDDVVWRDVYVGTIVTVP